MKISDLRWRNLIYRVETVIGLWRIELNRHAFEDELDGEHGSYSILLKRVSSSLSDSHQIHYTRENENIRPGPIWFSVQICSLLSFISALSIIIYQCIINYLFISALSIIIYQCILSLFINFGHQNFLICQLPFSTYCLFQIISHIVELDNKTIILAEILSFGR